MRIVLLRHGKPDVPKLGGVSASKIGQCIDAYNAAGVRLEDKPSNGAIEIANSCNVVVCSDLPRSIESAQALGVSEINHIESVFREMGLPFASFPSPKLSPVIWAAIFRTLWFMGFSSNSESLREAKIRALHGAGRLREIAEADGSVLLVGHGFVNRFIAKELLSTGWKGPACPGKKYWEFGVYEFVG